MPNQNLQKKTPHAATNMQSPLSLKPTWGVMLPNQAWNYVRKSLRCPISHFGLSEGYIFVKIMTGKFNNQHHQHQGTWKAWCSWLNANHIPSYMIEFNGNAAILKSWNPENCEVSWIRNGIWNSTFSNILEFSSILHFLSSYFKKINITSNYKKQWGVFKPADFCKKC